MTPRSVNRGRLSRSSEFERVYRQGRSTANRHLVLYAFPNPSTDRPRLGLAVSRKVGGAVERNRVKRLLREAFAGMQEGLRRGHDVVVVARPLVRELVDRDGLAGVTTSLAELLAKAGLKGAGTPGEAAGTVQAPRAQDGAGTEHAHNAEGVPGTGERP